MIRRLLLGLVGAFSVVLFTATPGSAPPGDLDPTFDGDGKVTTDFGDGDRAEGVVIQGDGKIVVAGSAGGTNRDFDPGFDFALARYRTDGSLDPTFGGDGKVTTDFSSSDDRAFAVALQPDGKIVAAGQAFVSERDFALARYNTDGSLDATFGGGDGKVSVDLAVDETDDAALAVAIQADDKIVAAGYVRKNLFHPGYPSDFAVARFNADGSPDVNFGVGGSVTTDIESDSDEAHGLAIQADGRIVAAGPVHVPSATVDFGLARFADGEAAGLGIGLIRRSAVGAPDQYQHVFQDQKQCVGDENNDDFVLADEELLFVARNASQPGAAVSNEIWLGGRSGGGRCGAR